MPSTAFDGLVEWVRASFPDFEWVDCDTQDGAFHDVVTNPADGVVGRVVHGRDHRQRAAREAAGRAVHALMTLPRPLRPSFVHGDFGPHNILWEGARPVSLIDLEHACIDDPAIDLAPLIGVPGAHQVSGIASEDVVRRAMIHRATLSLQVAAAAHVAGNHGLRDHALSNFAKRSEAGTLHDPNGASP